MPVSRIKTRLANRMAVTVTVLVAVSGVSAARDKTCAPVHNEAVVDTLNQLFEAANHDDDKLFNEVLAPNFYAFDETAGKRFDGMQLPQLIKAAHGAGKTDLRLVGQRPGSSHCLRLGVGDLHQPRLVGDASGTQPMSWLESAVLHYQGQRWHIQFLHSTRAAFPTSN